MRRLGRPLTFPKGSRKYSHGRVSAIGRGCAREMADRRMMGVRLVAPDCPTGARPIFHQVGQLERLEKPRFFEYLPYCPTNMREQKITSLVQMNRRGLFE